MGEVSSQTVALTVAESEAINELMAAYHKSLEIQMDKDLPRDRANLADLVNIAELSVRRVIAMAKQVCTTTFQFDVCLLVSHVFAAFKNAVFVFVTREDDTVEQQTNKHPFNGPFSGSTQVSRYQKGKTNLDFTGARDSEWQWHQLGHMQVCTLLQTDNHASTPPLSFFTGRMPFLPPNQQCQSTEGKDDTVELKC